MDKQSKGLIIGASAGLIAGAIAGILLAPQSGKETRVEINKYLHEMKDEIAEKLAKASKVTKKIYEEVVDKVVKVYEVEKKISPKDAKDIKAILDKNYAKVVKALNK